VKLCCAISFIVAALGSATEVASNEPPSFEGLNPTQIEKIMIEELIDKPKKGNKEQKETFDFVKTVGPVLDKFKKQLLEDKRKMQKQLDDNIKAIKTCIKKMKDSTKLGLLESEMEIEKKKKKTKKLVKKCPTPKDIQKCTLKIKNLKPEQKACKDLQKIGKKDVDTITELIKKWQKQKVGKKFCKKSKGETKLHYVSRLANHFEKKLKIKPL
jgi:dGTP triphosphohydrolase